MPLQLADDGGALARRALAVPDARADASAPVCVEINRASGAQFFTKSFLGDDEPC